MDNLKLRSLLRSIGKWYFVSFIEDVIKNYTLLQNPTYKKNFISRFCYSADGGEILLSSATTKVDKMLVIIRENAIKKALEQVAFETNPSLVPEGTIERAKAILKSIEKGIIVLP